MQFDNGVALFTHASRVVNGDYVVADCDCSVVCICLSCNRNEGCHVHTYPSLETYAYTIYPVRFSVVRANFAHIKCAFHMHFAYRAQLARSPRNTVESPWLRCSS